MIEIELDDTVLVQCPEKRFAFRMVKHCLNCEYYNGLSHATINGEAIKSEDPNDFQIICNRPITRKLTKIASD